MNVRIFLVALLLAPALPAVAGDLHDSAINSIEITPRTSAPDEQGRYLTLVRFKEASVARYRGGIEGLAATSARATGQRKLDVSSPAAVAYRDFLQTRQTEYIARINTHIGRSVTVHGQVLNVLNATSMWLSLDEARSLLSLDFVHSVHLDEEDAPDTDAGPQWIGAPAFWDGQTPSGISRRGEGMIIGIIDSGFNHAHPSFAAVASDGYQHVNPYGSGVFAGVCDTHPDAVCNDKLIGSYFLHTSSTTPEDTSGHGTHVASTAGGNPVTASLAGLDLDISGVAPRANLINYKVCEPLCSAIARVQAINHAISDGVDVLNHSIGDSFPWTSQVGLAFLDAHEAGIFVSASAGNEGPAPGSLNRGAPWAGIIGNSSHNRGMGHGVDAAELTGMVGIPSTGPDILAAVTGDVIDAAVADPGNAEGCDPFPANAFLAAIALIPRGGCSFVNKVNNAEAAGAVGVIVFNHLGGPPTRMGGLQATLIPSVMIDNEDGVAIQTALSDGAAAAGTINANFVVAQKDQWGDVIANLSSRGPATFDVVKPDIAAPGTNILAAHTDASGGYAMIGGTSMAAPHNAGAAALMMSEHPDWTPAQVLSAIALTAQPDDMVKTDGITPADPFDRGSGRLFLPEAARAGFVMSETIENFENANPLTGGDPRTLNIASMMNRECELSCTWERTITSVWPAAQQFNGAGAAPAGMTVTVVPDNFTLDPGQSLTLQITADVAGLPIEEWFFGEVIIEPVGNPDVAMARMPVVVMNPTEVQPPPPEAFIEVAPNVFDIGLDSGEAVTEILNISETGGELDLEWETVSGSLTLHDNGPLVTHPGEGPGGSDHSVLQSTTLNMSTLGVNISSQGAGVERFRIADDFTVPVAWEIETLVFFAYQTGSTTSSTFTEVTYRIWDGPPQAPGSNVVFGDTDTNRLQSTGWINAYRVSETAAGTTRPIMEIVADGGLTLEPGTYWVDVQLDGNLASGPWMAPVTITDKATTGDALRLVLDGGEEVWINWLDGNSQTQQGMPFEIGGTANCWDGAEIDWLNVVPPAGTVAANGSLGVELVFDADGLAPGVYETVICIASNASNSPLVFVPVALTVTVPGLLELDTQAHDFGEVEVDETELVIISVGNAGPDSAEDLQLSAIELSTDDGGFEVAGGDCAVGMVLAPDETCEVVLSFGPVAAESYAGELMVATADGQSEIVSLSGRGVLAPPVLAVEPGTVDFGDVPAGDTGIMDVTVSNAADEGAADLELTQLEVVLGGDAFVIGGGDCTEGELLAPQQSCTVEVHFTPPAASDYFGTLQVAAGEDQESMVNLSGSGIEPEPPVDEVFQDRFED